MIKFFRKIRQRLLTENKFSKYLLYAIGEIVLVVVGILIALQINNWNEARKNHNNLEGYLIFMLEDIESDKNQLIRLIQEREASFLSTTKIIDAYKNQSPIKTSDFLNAFNSIVVEQKFDNNTSGFDKVQNSVLFDSNKFQNIRKLIRTYQKSIDDVNFVEAKQNASSELMEADLLRNGFYDNIWADIRTYYQHELFEPKTEMTNYLKEINKYGELKAIFMRNEWVTPFIVDDYELIIDIGEDLKLEIERYLNL